MRVVENILSQERAGIRCAGKSGTFCVLPGRKCIATSNDCLKISNTAVVAIGETSTKNPCLSADQTNAWHPVLEFGFFRTLVLHTKFIKFGVDVLFFAIYTVCINKNYC